jgi:DNA-binding response OmpR family regulator
MQVTRVAVVALLDDRGRQIADGLRRRGLEPLAVPMRDALTELRELSPDAALVEFASSARDLIRELVSDKELADRLPFLAVLTQDELASYEAGPLGDDFLVWPSSPEELAARVRLAVRRRRGDEGEHLLRFGDLTIDLANYRVTVAGAHIQLTFKEYELLRFLASNRDRVFSREQLLSRVWGYD